MCSRIWIALVVAIALACVVAGCGEGGQEADQPPGTEATQGGGGGAPETSQDFFGRRIQDDQQQGGDGAPETETLQGRVVRIEVEKEKVLVSPEGGEPTVFKFRPERTRITLDGQEAAPEDIRKRQQATVVFFVRETEKGREVNVARSIKLGTGGGETTGG